MGLCIYAFSPSFNAFVSLRSCTFCPLTCDAVTPSKTTICARLKCAQVNDGENHAVLLPPPGTMRRRRRYCPHCHWESGCASEKGLEQLALRPAAVAPSYSCAAAFIDSCSESQSEKGKRWGFDWRKPASTLAYKGSTLGKNILYAI